MRPLQLLGFRGRGRVRWSLWIRRWFRLLGRQRKENGTRLKFAEEALSILKMPKLRRRVQAVFLFRQIGFSVGFPIFTFFRKIISR